MTTKTEEKIYKEVKELRNETKTLKELFFLVLRDIEGEYKESFVKQTLQKSHAKPQFEFTGKKDFLVRISS
jgi:hypothetical protein